MTALFTAAPFNRFFGVAASVSVATTPALYVANLRDDGVYMEWKVEKSIKAEPDRLELAIFNLLPQDRRTLAAAVSAKTTTSDGIESAKIGVTFSLGWDGMVAQAFKGTITQCEAERNEKGKDNVDAVTFLRALDGPELNTKATSGGAWVGAALSLLIAKILGEMGLQIAPIALKAINKAAGRVPLKKFKTLNQGDHKYKLNTIFATLRLGWKIENGLLVVFENGVRTDVLPINLRSDSGLLSYKVRNKGVKIKALANPLCVPGGALNVYDRNGQLVTGGVVYAQKVTLEGNTDKASTMDVLAVAPKAVGAAFDNSPVVGF